jgi:CheY-like chemotaxis protein
MGTVLLLDDDRAACLILRQMFISLGYSVDTVHNVSDGLRAASCKNYSVVVIDCFMPDHTGWVASRAVKLLPRDGPPPAVIGILSYPDEKLQRRCESSDMDGVMVKPYCKRALLECLAGCNSSLPSSCPSTCHVPRQTGSNRSYLSSANRGNQRSNLSTEREVSDMLLRVVDSNSMMLPGTGPLALGELNSH